MIWTSRDPCPLDVTTNGMDRMNGGGYLDSFMWRNVANTLIHPFGEIISPWQIGSWPHHRMRSLYMKGRTIGLPRFTIHILRSIDFARSRCSLPARGT